MAKKQKQTANAAVVEKKPERKEEALSETKKEVVNSIFARERVLTEISDAAKQLNEQSVFGILLEDGKVQLSLVEAFYLLEKGRLKIYKTKERVFTKEEFTKVAQKLEPNFWVRYVVFKDMRNRGYVVKTALKFGADFRVYDRGIKPGEDHAKWILYPVYESDALTWYEFAAKNRVAHSTKKRLLIGIVDNEDDVTYYEIKWTRP
ncbi:MAG: tRNA-intron lyase [Candidatus Woesearchaeota archaeon]